MVAPFGVYCATIPTGASCPAFASADADASGFAIPSVVEVASGAAKVDAAGEFDSVVEEELRATTISARIMIPTITAATIRLDEPLFWTAGFTTGVAAFTGAEETDLTARDPEVGTGGTTKLFTEVFLTDFLATFFAGAFFAVFFTTAFLAVAFLATFLAAVFFAGDFLAVFFAADFFTATVLLLGSLEYALRIPQGDT